jgi:hypothetical protein
MPRTTTDIVTLLFGAAVLLAWLPGSDSDHRLPAGAGAAIEQIANKPSRKFAQAFLVPPNSKIEAISRTNQGPLTAWHAQF